MTPPLSILSKFTGRALAVHESAIEELRALAAIERLPVLSARGDASATADEPRVVNQPFRVAADYWGNPVPRMFVRTDRTAVIPVKGMTTKGLGNMADYLGLADYDKIQGWLKEAAESAQVDRIALFIDSPGGMTVGSLEAAEAVVRAAQAKPVMAFTDRQMASAAYKIGAGADYMVATRSADVGSVGTFAYLPDASEYWKAMGIEWLVFRSGEFKGAGIDKMSGAQKDEMQREVDALGATFRAFVKSRRPAISEDDMQGQVFNGADALARGFVHGVAHDFEEALSRFSELTTSITIR